MSEGSLLSLIAAAGGIAVAYWCRNALVLAFPPPLPGTVIDFPGQIDWRVLAVSAGICMVSTLLFRSCPRFARAIRSFKRAQNRCGWRSRRDRPIAIAFCARLVVVSLSFILLAGTGLLLQSLIKMRNASPGFNTNVVFSVVDLFSAGYELDRAKVFHTQLLDRVRTLPGVDRPHLRV